MVRTGERQEKLPQVVHISCRKASKHYNRKANMRTPVNYTACEITILLLRVVYTIRYSGRTLCACMVVLLLYDIALVG